MLSEKVAGGGPLPPLVKLKSLPVYVRVTISAACPITGISNPEKIEAIRMAFAAWIRMAACSLFLPSIIDRSASYFEKT
jgi:hypothetical protein